MPPDPFPPHSLRDYALLADGERGALIGPTRRLRLDVRPALALRRRFSALVGGAGAYAVTPVEPVRVGWLLRARHA